MVILLGILRVFILYNVVSYVIHFIPLLFPTEPCFFMKCSGLIMNWLYERKSKKNWLPVGKFD